MTTIADVRTEIDRVFDAFGAPSWPNPHTGSSVAAEEEYSRITDPGRYHVLVLRLQAWQTVLEALCDIDVDTMTKSPGRLQQPYILKQKKKLLSILLTIKTYPLR